MSFLKQYSKSLILLLVLAAGILITAPYLNYQDYLSQGDHGRDLYAAQAVDRGELPYKDFWWVYGPLMPYYYGIFFKLFGVKISSMLLGKMILRILSGILMCLGMLQIASPITAFICACWFMLFQQDFFFTYNHIGGLVMVVGVTFCLLSYIQNRSSLAIWGALALIFTLCLIKINFGLAALAVTVITVAVCDFVLHTPFDNTKKLFYGTALIGIPLIVFGIYFSLLKGLSITEIRQCLPYMEGDQPFSMGLWTAIGRYLQTTFQLIISTWMNLSFALIINASALRCFYLLAKNKMPVDRKIILILSLGMLGLFYLANFHEYLKSGVLYRGFWSQPLSMMISFLLIDVATQSIAVINRQRALLFIGLLIILSWFSALGAIQRTMVKDHYLSLPRGGIYITNSPQWVATVEETTDYLNKTLKPNELFFALPYDCLYYYLTDRRSPTRQLIFFDHIKIPQEQEKSIIAELEKNHVNYILLSNRAFAMQETGLGFLGGSYCPLIGKYIQENFIPVTRFGDWHHEPGWAWNHGTMIFKRKGL